MFVFTLFSQIFGYFQTEDEDPEQVVNEDISVFTVAKKQKIGEAAGMTLWSNLIPSIVVISIFER